MLKLAGDAVPAYSLSGRLYLSSSGWLLLSVPNALVLGCFKAMDEQGISLPLKDGRLDAHISVMRKSEVDEIGAAKITERGKTFKFQTGPVKTVEPKSWDGVSKVWYLTVTSPELRKLRASYGLTPQPNEDWDFHITVAVKKTGVLRANGISKAADYTADDLAVTENQPLTGLVSRLWSPEHSAKVAAKTVTPAIKSKRVREEDVETCPHCQQEIGEKGHYVDEEGYEYHRGCIDKGPIGQLKGDVFSAFGDLFASHLGKLNARRKGDDDEKLVGTSDPDDSTMLSAEHCDHGRGAVGANHDSSAAVQPASDLVSGGCCADGVREDSESVKGASGSDRAPADGHGEDGTPEAGGCGKSGGDRRPDRQFRDAIAAWKAKRAAHPQQDAVGGSRPPVGPADSGPDPGRAVTPSAVPYDENGKPRPSWKKKADLESDIAAAEKDCEEPKSEEQARAGNYRHGHVKLHGLDITLETAKGMTRRGKDKSGTPWEIKMQHSYGYVKRTKSEADEDHFDVFLGEHPESELVFVVDQYLGDSFDEHKALLGCTTKEEAKRTYLANYCDGWKGCGDITSLTMPQFKEWVRTGDTSIPLAGQKLKFEQHAQPRALGFYTKESLRAKVAAYKEAISARLVARALAAVKGDPARWNRLAGAAQKWIPGAVARADNAALGTYDAARAATTSARLQAPGVANKLQGLAGPVSVMDHATMQPSQAMKMFKGMPLQSVADASGRPVINVHPLIAGGQNANPILANSFGQAALANSGIAPAAGTGRAAYASGLLGARKAQGMFPSFKPRQFALRQGLEPHRLERLESGIGAVVAQKPQRFGEDWVKSTFPGFVQRAMPDAASPGMTAMRSGTPRPRPPVAAQPAPPPPAAPVPMKPPTQPPVVTQPISQPQLPSQNRPGGALSPRMIPQRMSMPQPALGATPAPMPGMNRPGGAISPRMLQSSQQKMLPSGQVGTFQAGNFVPGR